VLALMFRAERVEVYMLRDSPGCREGAVRQGR